MKTSFQDGCNTIYDAIVSRGVTPENKTPDKMAYTIKNLLQKIIYSITFTVKATGYASNNYGSVTATGIKTYVLKSDGTLTDSGLSSSNTNLISYISKCYISNIALSGLSYDSLLNQVKFTISVNLTVSNGANTATSTATQSFTLNNKSSVSSGNMSNSNGSLTYIHSMPINGIIVSII